jgi:3-isopropylmalate/(R)-2-methylmalate dehydratase small subunit
MKAFRRTTGRVAVLDRPDVDTDQIIPKQFLKSIRRTGFAEGLFYDWRQDPGFELNDPAYAGAKILLAGRNFGCGSSREHAPWALQEYGFEALIGPSFADIFQQNCLKTGILTVSLPEERVRQLMNEVDPDAGSEVTVDLEARTITSPRGETFAFEVDDFSRNYLLEGLDEIGRTLLHEPAIAEFESVRPAPLETTALVRT